MHRSGTAARDDASTLQACADGDAAALEALYASHASACLAAARAVLVDAQYAEDAVQEAYLELWRCAARFDVQRSSVRAWLLMLTHRKAVDRVRAEQRRRAASLADDHDAPDDRRGPDGAALAEDAGRAARRALADLPEAKREALVLAYWGGYTQAEIAQLTSTPLGTVKSRMHGAMRDLRPVLAEDGWGPAALPG